MKNEHLPFTDEENKFVKKAKRLIKASLKAHKDAANSTLHFGPTFPPVEGVPVCGRCDKQLLSWEKNNSFLSSKGICNNCKIEENDKKKQDHLDKIANEYGLEMRIRNIESWIYDHNE